MSSVSGPMTAAKTDGIIHCVWIRFSASNTLYRSIFWFLFQAYVKFSGAPVNIVKSSNPFKSPTGKLPVFKCSEGAFSEFSEVTTFLRKQVCLFSVMIVHYVTVIDLFMPE